MNTFSPLCLCVNFTLMFTLGRCNDIVFAGGVFTRHTVRNLSWYGTNAIKDKKWRDDRYRMVVVNRLVMM